MTVVAFDLDDTLFRERDFLLSAYRTIARTVAGEYPIDIQSAYDAMASGGFDLLIEEIAKLSYYCDLTIVRCIDIYRTHIPDIVLDSETAAVLDEIARRDDTVPALITDGRIVTQTNKIMALGLDRYFSSEDIFISEAVGHDKLSPFSFMRLMERHPGAWRYVYVGDNPAKDFMRPRELGWVTIGLRDNGQNIHPQPTAPGQPGQPDCWVDTLKQIFPVIYPDTPQTYRET
ncbi:MAG: HAD family hydrolase [Pseudoflavonifractor sp.]|nr:HAD family hydrolase [Pseudoflavonifractor sp.]